MKLKNLSVNSFLTKISACRPAKSRLSKYGKSFKRAWENARDTDILFFYKTMLEYDVISYQKYTELVDEIRTFAGWNITFLDTNTTSKHFKKVTSYEEFLPLLKKAAAKLS